MHSVWTVYVKRLNDNLKPYFWQSFAYASSIVSLSMTCCRVLFWEHVCVANSPCLLTGVLSTCSLHRITVKLATKTVHLGQMKFEMPTWEESREAFVKVSNSVW